MNVLSLFDGKSGAMAALQSIGINPNNYYACEIDRYAQQVSRFHYPEIIRLGDVTKVSSEDLPKIDLLLAGFPCQAFSFAGKQLNFEDPRGKLFFEVVRLLNELKPKFFLLENVRMKKDVEEEINKLVGVKPVLISSGLLGSQNRLRNYWCGGYKDGKVYQIEIPQPEDKGILLRDIIDDIAPGDTKPISNKIIKIGNVNPSGKGMGGEVYSIDGKCPTLTTNKGEGIKITGGAQRGRYLDENGKRLDSTVDSQSGLTEQRIEVRDDGKSNCLTTVQKDSLVAQLQSANNRVVGVSFNENGVRPHKGDDRKSGISELGTLHFENSKSSTLIASHAPNVIIKDSLCIQVGEADINAYRERKAVYSIYGKCPTLLTASGGNHEKKITEDNLTWRKLTVKECCRLQNYPDNYCDYGIDEKGNQVAISKSQAYKMLGNGFDRATVAHCLKYILNFESNKMNCKNCKWLCDPEMESVCVNSDSDHCADFVSPNDSCSEFEHTSIFKTGEKWGEV